MSEEGAEPASSPPRPAGILVRVAYDGRGFSGYAAQPDRRTIAGELLGAIAAVDPAVKAIRGSSRTDAGVHAMDQCVAFDPERVMPPKAWTHWINRELGAEIAVRAATSVPRGFEPRHHAAEKTYHYRLLFDDARDPLLDGRVWRLAEGSLTDETIAAMNDELAALVGEHDFAAFRSASDPRVDTTRTIHRASVRRSPDDARLATVEVTGSGFMHNMVRIIVGAAVDVGRRRLPKGAVGRGLETKQRTALGVTAPPDGLYLYSTRLDLPAG